jgi:hypothetical protein
LINSSVAHDLGGAVAMQFEPHGLHCSIEFPIAEGTRDENDSDTGSRISTGIERA